MVQIGDQYRRGFIDLIYTKHLTEPEFHVLSFC